MPLRQAIERSQGWHRRLTVPQFTVVTGLLVILLGTLLLATPLCSSSKVGLWEALFTATSAITVTGLSIIDVGADLTTAGQLVLAMMILAGGLGLMAITTFLQGFVVKGTGLRRRLDRGQTLDEFGVGGVGSTFRGIAATAALVILVGALVLYGFGFSDIPDRGERLWASVFHSISAYNNAGFGLWSDSLERYHDNVLVNAVVMVLIVMGGLGWRVTSDLASHGIRRGRRRLSLHTRLVLRTTLLLVVFGTLGLALTEWLNRGEVFIGMAWRERWMTALFESVTARTAGFTTVPFTTNPWRNVVMAISPRPPARIIIASTSCPAVVRSAPTSMIDRPVTVIADVAVNRASQSPTLLLEHSGVANNNVPSRITSRPVTTVNWGTVSRRCQPWLRSIAWRRGTELTT